MRAAEPGECQVARRSLPVEPDGRVRAAAPGRLRRVSDAGYDRPAAGARHARWAPDRQRSAALPARQVPRELARVAAAAALTGVRARRADGRLQEPLGAGALDERALGAALVALDVFLVEAAGAGRATVGTAELDLLAAAVADGEPGVDLDVAGSAGG